MLTGGECCAECGVFLYRMVVAVLSDNVGGPLYNESGKLDVGGPLR